MKGIKEYENQIWAYLDGVASQEERAEVERLLGAEPEFARLFDEYKTLDQELKSLEAHSPSMRFSKTVAEKAALMHRQKASPVSIIPGKVLKGIIPAILAIFIVVIWGGLSQPSEPSGYFPIVDNIQRLLQVFDDRAIYLFSICILSMLILFLVDKFVLTKFFTGKKT